ncbi:MAG: aspartate kinase [Deltaproteobacteria bacterium]|nr:aspartate kinase [Deltaproteobacteria bacterium]
MIVMKFGGTSVKDAEAVDRVAGILAGRIDERPVVVVSAFGDTTDALEGILSALDRGDAGGARAVAGEIGRGHADVVGRILTAGPAATEARDVLEGALERLRRLIDGMECLGEVSARSRDAVLASGEMLSAPLLALFLSSRGLKTRAADPRFIVATDEDHGRAAPLVDETATRARSVLLPMIGAGAIPVVGGYVGASIRGVVTTLGRGGSDLTASLLAKALGADTLEYWKDVDGILTADPQLVPDARPVPRLSFREAAELAFLGARVLHPASIQPAVEAGIPVRVRNSYKPTNPGTLIFDSSAAGRISTADRAVSSVACKRDQVLVNVYSTRMLGARGFLRRVFEVFDRLAISVDHIATSEVNVTVTMAPTDRVEQLKAELGAVAEIGVTTDVGVVSVVGESLPSTPGVAARVFGALSDINVRLVTYGGSGVNLSLVVADRDVPLAVRRLHAELCAASDEGT